MVMNTFTIAVAVFVVGLVLFCIGIALAKICKTSQKIHERGFDIPQKIDFWEGMEDIFQNPDIFIPMMLLVAGALFIISSVVLAIASFFI